MRWSAAESLALTLALAWAPAHTSVTPLTAVPTVADQLSEMASAALATDGRLASSDSLYAADAVVLAEGRRRRGGQR